VTVLINYRPIFYTEQRIIKIHQ